MFFFLVFFSGQIYTRHFATYRTAMTIQGRIADITMTVRSRLLHIDPMAATDFVRYMNAAHVLLYVGISDTYESDFFLALNKHELLLTKAEMKRLVDADVDVGIQSCNE